MPKKCYGVGVNDMRGFERKGNKIYQLWHSVLTRCYRQKLHAVRPTYQEATVCEEWLNLSNFYIWAAENYVEGWVLDKDILVPGNKVYSPSTCVFVPTWVNALFSNMAHRERNGLPMGVHHKHRRFSARFGDSYGGTFDTAEQAHQAYLGMRHEKIVEMAQNFAKIPKADERVTWALLVLASPLP